MKIFLHFLVLNLLSFALTACFHDDDKGGGWITITSPTSAHTYSVENTGGIDIAGEVFVSSGGRMREETWCDCVGWACLFYPPEYFQCFTESYYDSAITITVTNDTTGQVVNGRVYHHGESNTWSTSGSVSLVLGENVIRVHAVDERGNNGRDQITVFCLDTLAPSVSFKFPEANTVVDIPDFIVVYFSETIDTNASTISSFTLNDGGTNVPGTISFTENNLITFMPSAGFSYNTMYEVTLSASIQDLSGNTSLINTSWSFTTTLAPAPANLQASTDNGQITLSWDAKIDADSYNIYYDTSPVNISSG
ncbi:MAG: Ig-like domain-containing protein, partial [Gammaproteobacteria bacterium]|nr:Ig-like domain-containing protein [Gammaproteobacteria bacterium]